jgi:DNA-binding response OmpR family regulator
MPADTVVVVEDDHGIRDLLRRYLERAGFGVLATESGAEALRWIEQGQADVVVLDLGLPDVPGEDVLAAARDHDVPTLVLTARGTVADRIQGLEQGAADYVTKPFSPREVVLRVRSVHRRRSPGRVPVTTFDGGRLVIDEVRHEVSLADVAIDLTPTEWGLLSALASWPGRAFSRYELANRVRGYEFEGYERTIDSHVKNLRHKLGENGDSARIVLTVPGVGYRLGVDRDE